MEVEQMNHMSNDQIRKRVKTAKDSFERVRRELRKVQNAKAASEVGARKKDQFEIVRIFWHHLFFQEMEDLENKEASVIRENNRRLD